MIAVAVHIYFLEDCQTGQNWIIKAAPACELI